MVQANDTMVASSMLRSILATALWLAAFGVGPTAFLLTIPIHDWWSALVPASFLLWLLLIFHLYIAASYSRSTALETCKFIEDIYNRGFRLDEVSPDLIFGRSALECLQHPIDRPTLQVYRASKTGERLHHNVAFLKYDANILILDRVPDVDTPGLMYEAYHELGHATTAARNDNANNALVGPRMLSYYLPAAMLPMSAWPICVIVSAGIINYLIEKSKTANEWTADLFAYSQLENRFGSDYAAHALQRAIARHEIQAESRDPNAALHGKRRLPLLRFLGAYANSGRRLRIPPHVTIHERLLTPFVFCCRLAAAFVAAWTISPEFFHRSWLVALIVLCCVLLAWVVWGRIQFLQMTTMRLDAHVRTLLSLQGQAPG
ncbi:MAG: hypothetical protein H6730_01355 [Deltaproteobacteria bacterium]|nr:hypothetical protein [Deltaproteobacteria bacterium]